MSSTRPEPKRQDTSQVLSYYFRPSEEAVDNDVNTRRLPRTRTASTSNRKLAIVEVDNKEPDAERHQHLALVGPPDTAPLRSGNTSPRDVGIVGGSFAAFMDQTPVPSLAPLPVFQPSERQTTPLLTPAIGESKQIDAKVAPPVMTRLGSQDDWLSSTKPASPTKPAPPPARGAPPPRPPRLHSPPPRASPVKSLASAASSMAPPVANLAAPGGMVRGHSDYSIIAVSDSSASERTTPREEGSEPMSSAQLPVNGSGSSHRREGAFPAHSVFASQPNSHAGDGLPDSASITNERAFYLADRPPLRVVGESEVESDDDDDNEDLERTPHARKNTITSRLSRTHTTTSSVSHYTQSSGSHYTSSNVSRKNTQHSQQQDIPSGADDMEDLIATVGTALADLGLDPADVPPPTVFPPPDESKPSRPGSTDGHGARSSPMASTVNLVQSNGSPRTSASDFVRGSPRTSVKDISRGSPRTSVSDAPRGSSRTGSVDFPRTEPRDSPRPSMTDLSRGSPRPSLRNDTRPTSYLGSRSGSPASRPRERSPDKPRLVGRGPVRSRSPEKPSVPMITRSPYEQTSPGTASSGSTHTYPSPQTPSPRTLPRAKSSNSLARGAGTRSSPLRNMVDQPRFRERGAPMPECFMFEDVLRMKTSAERAQGYVRKINQLAAEDSGLKYWVGFMKGRVKPPGPDGHAPPPNPISPSALLTTFGPNGPGTRRHQPQPRHVSSSSATSEATFAVRPDAYVATNISIRAESPPLGQPPPSLPYPSLARDIGVRSVPPTSPGVAGLRAKTGAVGFFSSIGRKTSTTKRDRDRVVMQQARKPYPGGGGYAELPASNRTVQLSAVPTIPGGPRARGTRRDAESIRAMDTGSSSSTSHPRSSVIMIGGRDSFQTISSDGRPVSIRVPSSNGHGVVVPNLPPLNMSSSPLFGSSPTDTLRSGMRSPDARSSYRSAEGGSVYSGRESVRDRDSVRDSMRERESMYGVRGSGVPGHGGNLDQLADVLPHVDRGVLAGYLERAGGHEIDAIGAYLEDEKRMNSSVAGPGSNMGHGPGSNAGHGLGSNVGHGRYI